MANTDWRARRRALVRSLANQEKEKQERRVYSPENYNEFIRRYVANNPDDQNNAAASALVQRTVARPRTYTLLADDKTLSDQRKEELTKNAAMNVRPTARETAEWAYDVREHGQNDTQANVLNRGTQYMVSDAYLQSNIDAMKDRIASAQQNNADILADDSKMHASELQADKNRAITEYVMDTIQNGESYDADAIAGLKAVFGDMTDREAMKMLSQIHSDPEGFLNNQLHSSEETVKFDHNIGLYEDTLGGMEEEQATREMAAAARSAEDWDTASQYIMRTGKNYQYARSLGNVGLADDLGFDVKYDFINNPDYFDAAEGYNPLEYESYMMEWRTQGLDLLTGDEIEEFNYYSSQSDEAGQRYLDSKSSELTRRAAEASREYMNYLADEYPISTYLMAAATNVANAFTYPVQVIDALDGSVDNTGAFGQFTQGIRQRQGENAAEALDWEVPLTGQTLGGLLYNTSTAATDLALAALTGSGLGGANAAAATKAIMGSQAASATLQNDIDAGVSPEGAVVHSLLSAVIEALTEKYSIEAFLADPNSLVRHIAKNYLTEASEEGASNLLNAVGDEFVQKLTGNKSELMRQYNDLILSGMSEQEATSAVLQDFVQNLSGDMFVGGLVGGLAGGVSAVSYSAKGSQLKKSGTGEQLMQIAEQMPEDSKSKKLANKITKTKSNFATAQLYNTLAEELPGAQDVLDNITTAGLANQLRDEGEEGDTQAVAKSIVKLLRGNQLTAEEYSALAQSKHGMSVLDATVKINQRDSGEMQAYDTAYKAGFYGQQAAEGMNTEYYQAGVEAAQKAEQARLNRVGKTGLKGGGVTYVGAASTRADVYGGKVQALNTETLSPQQRVAVQALEGLSKVSGMNFVLYEGQADANGNITIENGSFDSKTNTIYLDLNAGKNRADQGVVNYAILRTAAHEMTHFIESNSKDGYAALKKFVVNELTARGQNFDALVEGKMRTAANQGVELTRGGAVAEVIADACEMALKDTQAIRRLAKQDKSLYGRIKSFLRDLMGKIRKALEGVGAAHAESRALMDAEKYIDGLQKLWDDALVEAVETAKNAKEVAVEDIKPSAQFELRASVEKRTDGLVAVHNLSATKLLDTILLGGFPMPSVAIIKAAHGHDMYGDYSVVFAPETIDPQANKANRVYGNDAWTPVFPPVETEIDNDALYDLEKEIEATAKQVDDEFGRKSRTFFGIFSGSDVTGKTMEDIAFSAWNNAGMLAAYLAEQGKNIKILETQVDEERGYKPEKAEQYNKILDIVDLMDYMDMPMHELLNKYGDRLAEVSSQLSRLNVYWKKEDRRAGASMARIIKEAIAYEGAGRDVSEKKRTVKDYQATEYAMKEMADRDDFNRWVAQKMEGVLGRKGIYNGKDRFTPMGNRKSFKQTHYDYTVENVVRAMLQEVESGIPAVNASGLKAAASTRYGSLDEIRADSYRLGKVTDEDFNARMAKADNDLHDFFNAVQAWDYDVQEKAGELLVTASKRKLNASGIAQLFKANGFKKATLQAAKIAESVIRQVQTIPTGYFEAKPARVVSFDEVRMVIAPDDIPAKLADALRERGIAYTTYDGSKEDRVEKLNDVEGVQFSPREINDPQLKLDASQITNADVKAMLQACKANTAQNYKNKDSSYIPIKKDTPAYLLQIASAKQAPLVMQVLKARQAMAPESMRFGTSHGHAMTPDEIVACIKRFESPEYVGYDDMRDRAAIVIVSPVDRRSVVVCFDFEQNKNPDFMNGYRGGAYNVVVTMFKRGHMDDTIEYLENSGYKEKTPNEEASAADVPALSNQEFYKKSIPHSSDFDNPLPQKSLRETTPEDLAREYLESMQPTNRMTDSEKWLLNKYQTTLAELREKETAAAEQDAIAQSAQTHDDRVKAQNRAKILRTQANRLRNTLRSAERADGFASLLRMSEKVARRFADSMDKATGTHDDLDAELQKVQNQLASVARNLKNAEAGQKAAFARGLFEQKALNDAGNNIRKAFNTRMSGKAIADRLALAYAELYAAEDEGAQMRFASALHNLAVEILESSRNRYRSATLEMLRETLGGSIGLSEAQKQELKKAGISMAEFRRGVGSVANVSEGGNNIASIVSSGEYYGNGIIAQLSSADSEGDMIMTLYNLIREEKALEQANTLEGMSESESISYVMAEIMQEANFPMVEDAGNVQALREALLLGAEKNKAVAAKVDAAIKSAINAKSRASSLWRNAAQVEAAGREALEYYRAIDEQRRLMEQEEIIRHLKSEAAQKLRDSTKIKDLSMKSAAKERHIQQIVKRLHKLRTGETDYKNIPEYLKGFVGEVVTLFGENYGAMVWSKEQADRVVSLYERLNSADGPYAEIAPFFDEDMMDTLKALREWAEKYEQLRYGKGVTRLERAQLRYLMDEAVADLVDHVNAIVRNSRNLFNAGRKQQFAQIGTAVKDELLEREDKTVLLGKPGTVAKWIDNAIRTGNITPVYFFEQLGNHELSALFNDFRQGQEEYAFTLDAVQDKIRNLKEQYDYNAWKDAEELAFQTSQGHNITLTKEQALWLYATWKREQANDIAATEHLTKGGFVYEGNADPNGKKGLLQKGRSNTTGHLISEKDMAVVDNYLTAEEKAYADAMVELLSKDMAALGNRVSMEMFGIRKYKEKYYFPYKTVGDQLNQTSLTGATNTTDDSRLKHGGFTHRLTSKARTALVMGNFSDVVANHVSQMVTYSSFVLPIENMNRVLNYRFETDDGSQSTIRSLIRQKYGENALKYIETFLHDMNGGIRSDTRSGVGALVSLHKKAAVVASLSVALQQPSSILRAAALMNPKYLLKGTVTKADYEELKEHSGVAIIKQMGRFDTNVGRSNVEWLLEDDYSKLTAWQKAKQALNPKDWESFKYRWNVLATGLPTIMDEISWGKLWNAVKAEQADLHPDMDHSSDEFLDMCGERFNDIVDHTQVYDSLLAKSQLMRSKSDIDKMVTSFAAEPTLTLNMLYDAFANKNHPDRKKRIWSTVFSITASSLAAAIGSALISAWNKDDDKRTAQEKLLNKTVSAFIDNMNPLNNIPYIRDLYSLFQGYEVERADMSIFSDIVSAVQKVKSSNYTGYRKVEELAGSIANLFGVPVKNVMRDLRRIYNAATSDWTDPTQTGIETAWVDAVDEAFPFVDWYKTGVNDYYERDLNAMLKGDKAMVSDISRYLREVRGKEDKDIMSGVKSAAKDRVKNGSLDSDDAIEALTKAYPDDVDADTLYWDYEKLKTGSTTKYEAFYTAIESGKDLQKEIQRYLDNGVSKETLADMISKKYQTTLAELYKTNKTKAADLQAKLLAAYVLLGYDREKKLKDIKKWYE